MDDVRDSNRDNSESKHDEQCADEYLSWSRLRSVPGDQIYDDDHNKSYGRD